MKRALAVFRNGNMNLRKAATTYKVPKATLKRRLDGKNINAVEHKKHFGRSVDLPEELEEDLVKHILMLEENFFGVTRNDLRKLAFQIAEQNLIPHRFNKETKIETNGITASFAVIQKFPYEAQSLPH